MPTVDEVLAGSRHVVSYTMGLATAFGVVKVGGLDLSVISTSLDHIFNGVKEISIGIAPIATVAMAWWATHKQAPATKVADVAALPGVDRVVVKSSAPAAVLEMMADPAQPKVARV